MSAFQSVRDYLRFILMYFALIVAMSDEAISSSTVRVWIIDDDIQFCRDLVALWRERAPRDQTEFHLYPTAAEALHAFRDHQHNATPHAILIDGYLARDDGDLRYGANVVRRILKGDITPFPILIGFSADTYANDDMVAAGAIKAFQKIKYTELIVYLQSQLPPHPLRGQKQCLT
ncbi:hypothetical protein CCAX7_61630 [Capsulimonas corticalis]|uniref:Uncharacterized protein n=1 Tax=Capsulimonas corticalis TaxID=2219043 RepID=A0A402CWC4_9BACT|nr:hypothetical protein [Capsulimonas corticalis]BDI34112.1 hypothetical protein CCAX7_61630 [Capsulimonas corticalis]